MAGNIFKGGVPTEPDVNLLMVKFGIPQIGTSLAYEDIEETLQLERSESRWRCVVMAWRKKLYDEHNILLIAIKNTGYMVADDKRRVEFGSEKHEQGVRSIKKGRDVLVKTNEEELDVFERKKRDHLLRVGSTLIGAYELGKREIKWHKQLVEKNGSPDKK